ncbi:MAG: hypothetical protein R3234_13430 [Thermoanaerobaculia bacterium]|nr:hypothetical protein [Thermoanaerobaculia bacterium]
MSVRPPSDDPEPAPPDSEYDPLGSPAADTEDLLRVQELFSEAARPFVSFPWSWLAWALVLPLAAILTGPVAATHGASGVLLLWSGAILVGGLVEGYGIRRGRGRHGRSSLGSWVLRVQGNLSLVALILSAAAVVADQATLLPGIWLLLLGHSFYVVGGLAFAPFRAYGLTWQLAGAVALWPGLVDPLLVLASVAFFGNLWMAWKVWGSE